MKGMKIYYRTMDRKHEHVLAMFSKKDNKVEYYKQEIDRVETAYDCDRHLLMTMMTSLEKIYFKETDERLRALCTIWVNELQLELGEF